MHKTYTDVILKEILENCIIIIIIIIIIINFGEKKCD
jgi:hypothetical protein